MSIEFKPLSPDVLDDFVWCMCSALLQGPKHFPENFAFTYQEVGVLSYLCTLIATRLNSNAGLKVNEQ